jgi:hypothetical protein
VTLSDPVGPSDPLTPLSPKTPYGGLPPPFDTPIGPPPGPPQVAPAPFGPPPPPSGSLTCNYTQEGGSGTASFTTSDPTIKQCPPYIFPGLILVKSPTSDPLTPA